MVTQNQLDNIYAKVKPYPGTQQEAPDHEPAHVLIRRCGQQVVVRDHAWSVLEDGRWFYNMMFALLDYRPMQDPIMWFRSQPNGNRPHFVKSVIIGMDWERHMVAHPR